MLAVACTPVGGKGERGAPAITWMTQCILPEPSLFARVRQALQSGQSFIVRTENDTKELFLDVTNRNVTLYENDGKQSVMSAALDLPITVEMQGLLDLQLTVGIQTAHLICQSQQERDAIVACVRCVVRAARGEKLFD